jgi:hypothetical protein
LPGNRIGNHQHAGITGFLFALRHVCFASLRPGRIAPRRDFFARFGGQVSAIGESLNPLLGLHG